MICLDESPPPLRPPPEGSIFCDLEPFQGVPKILPENWNAVCYGIAGRNWKPLKPLKGLNEEMKMTDMETLEDKSFLNDTVIDAYLELVKNAAEPYLFGKHIHLVNCFFYTILAANGRKDGFKRSKIFKNLFDAKLFIIPVHDDNHWVIAFVDVQNGVLTVADSLGRNNFEIEQTIIKFLKDEAKAQGHVTRYTDWEACDIEVSRQRNGYDCGIFICQFARYITRGYMLTSVQQLYMPYYRRRMKYEIAEYVILRD